MEIKLGSSLSKRLLILLELVGFLVLLVEVSRPLAADRWATKLTVLDLEHAIRLDPGNSDYRLELGRLYRYDLSNVNAEKALEYLKRAVESDPYFPEAWIDLAAALEFQGRIAETEACLRRAGLLAPHLSNFQWIIGNFFLLHGNLDDAFRAYRIVLAGTSEYDRVLFDTAWKASGDGPRILADQIPDRITTEFEYINYLTLFQHYAEAQNVWKRIASSIEAFPPTLAAPYLDKLIESHQPDWAYQVWTDLRSKGLIRPTDEETSRNLVINGDFEDTILNMGFDWRFNPVEGAYTGLDRTYFQSPSQSVVVQFTGKQNVNYRGIHQYVRVEPGRAYQFRGFIKTEGITTNSGPRFEVRDASDDAILGVSENFTGGTESWTPVIINFESSTHTHLVDVGLARPPSEKLDNLIAGTAWIDDLSLTPQPPEAEGLGK